MELDSLGSHFRRRPLPGSRGRQRRISLAFCVRGGPSAAIFLHHAKLTYSCRTTLKRELLTWISPLYWIKPSFRNLFMKKLTRDRVVPIISASISCDTLGSTC